MKAIATTSLFLLGGACAMEADGTEAPTTNEVEQAAKKTSTVKVTVNGRSVDTFLGDGETNGFLNASEDQIAGTYSLEFSIATPDPVNPDLVVLHQGAGAIPSGALTITDSSAHLTVTTPAEYEIIRCELDVVTGDVVCGLSTEPLSFDLTWTSNGLASTWEKIKRRQTFGPIVTKYEAELDSLTADVSGTWAGHTSEDLAGNISDTQSKTVTREIITPVLNQ